MKRLLAMLLLLATALQAAEWRNDAFGCSVNLPETDGWEAVPAPAVPGVTVLVAMQNPRRMANFIVTVVDNAPGTDLNDAKVQAALAGMLRAFTYEFYGFSKVAIGGLQWLQYPVTSRAGGVITKGVVRFTSGNGRVYGVSLMLQGGKEAAQDVELQTIAASFRLLAPSTVAATQPAASAATSAPAPSGSATQPASPPETPATTVAPDQDKVVLGFIPERHVKPAALGAGALLILLLLVKIIGGGSSAPRK